MRIALGVLGWTPETFWKSTPHEFVAAYEGSIGDFGQEKIHRAEFKKLLDDVKEADKKNGNNN